MHGLYYIYSTDEKVTQKAAKRIQERIDQVGCGATFVGPLNIPGRDITAWIERPNDGLSETVYQVEVERIKKIANEELGTNE